jgi:nucleotide-binding universal stress UspA family protein
MAFRIPADRLKTGRGAIRMKILIGYDGSEAAKAGLELALQAAKKFKVEVHVVTSLVGSSLQFMKSKAQGEQDLAFARRALEEQGVACRTRLVTYGQSAGESLVEYAAENDISVIFVGVTKKSRVDKFLLGSTAQYVILQAPCPVLTVKGALDPRG